jgi:hypothetical protein
MQYFNTTDEPITVESGDVLEPKRASEAALTVEEYRQLVVGANTPLFSVPEGTYLTSEGH